MGRTRIIGAVAMHERAPDNQGSWSMSMTNRHEMVSFWNEGQHWRDRLDQRR
jgi:hypothetical protein